MVINRKYGEPPYRIVLVHGGPGAAGSLALLAQKLSSNFSVVEHLQRKDTIKDQILELKRTIEETAEVPVILIGHSWGAWLSYLLTAGYQFLVRKLILIGSGPFEDKYVSNIQRTRYDRLTEDENKQIFHLMSQLDIVSENESNRIFCELGKLMDKADACNSLPEENNDIECDYSIYKKVWEQASFMRIHGTLLNAGKWILCPVIAIHGDYDSHPYKGVEEPLSKVLADFRFFLLENCGHKPWNEKYAKDKFFSILKEILDEIKDPAAIDDSGI